MLLNLLLDSKWKADKHGVRCMRLGPKGSTLLSAGRSIKLWDLETKETLKVTKELYLTLRLSKTKQVFSSPSPLPSFSLFLCAQNIAHSLGTCYLCDS